MDSVERVVAVVDDVSADSTDGRGGTLVLALGLFVRSAKVASSMSGILCRAFLHMNIF